MTSMLVRFEQPNQVVDFVNTISLFDYDADIKYEMCIRDRDLPPVIFADGVNEMGFAAAVLYFPGYAKYDDSGSGDIPEDPRPPIAAIELVSFLLGLCASVRQAASMLDTIRIVGRKDSITNTVAPLHWILADQDGACMVAERTEGGLRLMDNPCLLYTSRGPASLPPQSDGSSPCTMYKRRAALQAWRSALQSIPPAHRRYYQAQWGYPPDG